MTLKVQAPREPLFTRRELWQLVLPLIIEQLLLMTVGIADTMMVASAGETAVSGVSLVNGINNLIIQVFAALSTGGAVVVSQYLGRREQESAGKAAAQLLYIMLGLSTLLMLIGLFLRGQILHGLFGRVEPDVMRSAMVYFLLTAAAYPLMGLYNAGSALFRAMGNSRVSMWCALLVNIINIGINGALIYGLHMGAAGAGIGTLVSRGAAAVFMLVLLRRPGQRILLPPLRPVRLSRRMIRSILTIGVPNGLENGIFQIGKLLVLGLITSFGTAAVAADAIANSITAVTDVPGFAIGMALITVIGHCMGAGEVQQARWYTRRMMPLSMGCMAVSCFILVVFSPSIVPLLDLSPEASRLAVRIMFICGVGDFFIWPLSFTLPSVLRAAGDAFFTMMVAQCSMFACRIALSYVFACDWGLGLGLEGVWLAMVVDWIVRAVCFTVRYERGRWESFQLLK